MIFIDPEGVFVDLKKILREMQEFPAAAEVAVSEGGASTVSVGFRSAVSDAARVMGDTTQMVIDSLNATQQTIREAVELIAAQDAELANETKTFLSLLDSAVEQGSGDAQYTKNEFK